MGGGVVRGGVVRSLVLWIPDWPVVALGSAPVDDGLTGDAIAVLEAGVVAACTPAARAAGVRRGQRRRDAQARCPRLRVVPADPDRDWRAFEPVLAAVERLAPGVQPLRPGLCALRARGPARYYGGEEAAAHTLLAALAGRGMGDARAGVADGPFTAEHAARRAPAGGVLVVPAGGAAGFLAPLPVTVLDEAAGPGELRPAGLLARLGVHTLGRFAELEAARVLDRFGPQGARLHDLSTGRDSRPVEARTPPPELAREVAFEPALELVDQVAFGIRVAADEFVAGLGREALVCTELRVRLRTEGGAVSERVWLHPGSFDAAGVVDRVRWQVQALAEAGGGSGSGRAANGAGGGGDGAAGGGVSLVRIEPAAVDAASHHQPALFGAGTDQRVHHTLSRVQAMLGHRSVLTAAIGGGRWLAERQVLVPWGDREPVAQRDRPWPGSLPSPLPGTVFAPPPVARVADAAGEPVAVDARGVLSAPPAVLEAIGRRCRIQAWAGPWPVQERGWDAARARSAHRFQFVDAEHAAWLVVHEAGAWTLEARYD